MRARVLLGATLFLGRVNYLMLMPVVQGIAATFGWRQRLRQPRVAPREP